jgi:hypothetical protein
MKEVAILLLVALMLNGCSSNSTAVQTAASGGWQAEMSGGDGVASGFSFITQWTVSGGSGALSVSNFQFLTQINGGCFPVTGETPTGNLKVTFNAADQVTGTFSFTIASGGNTLTLTSTSVTGTINTTNNTLSNGVIIGNWAVVGSGNGCSNVSGTFNMTQTASG